MRTMRAVAGVAFALTLGIVGQAHAQYRPTGPVAGRRGNGNGNGNGTTTIQVPPPLLGPMSLGLIERDFQYLRATSPNPDRFMGGRWNPQTIEVPRTLQQNYGYGYGYGYPGYGYGYPGYGYGSGIYFNGGIGGGYLSGGYQSGPTIIQRETVIIREGQSGRVSGGEGSRPEQREDDFYLGRNPQRRQSVADERLTDALDDIRKAWLNGDSARLETRFDGKAPVAIFIRGRYKYDVAGKEFFGMLKDAMKRIDTMSFEFDRPKASEPGKAFVTGKHTFMSAEKEKQETFISYGLQRIDGRWLITEAGSSSEPVSVHARETAPPKE